MKVDLLYRKELLRKPMVNLRPSSQDAKRRARTAPPSPYRVIRWRSLSKFSTRCFSSVLRRKLLLVYSLLAWPLLIEEVTKRRRPDLPFRLLALFMRRARGRDHLHALTLGCANKGARQYITITCGCGGVEGVLGISSEYHIGNNTDA